MDNKCQVQFEVCSNESVLVYGRVSRRHIPAVPGVHEKGTVIKGTRYRFI